METVKAKALKGKLKSGDTFWLRCDVSDVTRDDQISFTSPNGNAVNSYLIQGTDVYFDNEVMVDKEILERNRDELILIDGKEIPKELIKNALKDYIK